jgi:hypothetical protein
MDRQSVGLRTNTTGATAEALKKIVDSHVNALKYGIDSVAMQDESWLTSMEENLCSVHSKLCPDIRQSGRYRESRVRASDSAFVSPNDIRSEMINFSLALEWFQTTCLSSTRAITNDYQWCESVHRKITIAAVIMFGINDIHPFQDGNGRITRIFMNIALKRLLGLPFTIVVCATVLRRNKDVPMSRGLKIVGTALSACRETRCPIPVQCLKV